MEEEAEKALKLASLKRFSRVKADDPEIVENISETLREDAIARLKIEIIDDEKEIARRTEHKALAEAELAKYE